MRFEFWHGLLRSSAPFSLFFGLDLNYLFTFIFSLVEAPFGMVARMSYSRSGFLSFGGENFLYLIEPDVTAVGSSMGKLNPFRLRLLCGFS